MGTKSKVTHENRNADLLVTRGSSPRARVGRGGFECGPVMLVEGVRLLVANGSEDFGIGSDGIWGTEGQ